MGFTDLRPYFRTAIKQVGGLTEWEQQLNTDNIPATKLHGAFHIEVGEFGSFTDHQSHIQGLGTVTVKLFAKGQGKPQDAIDWVIAKGQAVVEQALSVANRSSQTAIKNIKLSSFDPKAYAPSDDSDIELKIVFDVILLLTIPRGV